MTSLSNLYEYLDANKLNKYGSQEGMGLDYKQEAREIAHALNHFSDHVNLQGFQEQFLSLSEKEEVHTREIVDLILAVLEVIDPERSSGEKI